MIVSIFVRFLCGKTVVSCVFPRGEVAPGGPKLISSRMTDVYRFIFFICLVTIIIIIIEFEWIVRGSPLHPNIIICIFRMTFS